MGAASVVLVIVLAAGYLLIRNSRVELEEMLAQNSQEKVLAEMNDKLDDIALVATQRKLADTRREFLKRFQLEGGPVDEMLLALSHLVPEQMTIFRMVVSEDTTRTAEIYGRVQCQGFAANDSTFNVFYLNLLDSGLFLKVAEPEISARVEEGINTLNFRLSCQLPS